MASQDRWRQTGACRGDIEELGIIQLFVCILYKKTLWHRVKSRQNHIYKHNEYQGETFKENSIG